MLQVAAIPNRMSVATMFSQRHLHHSAGSALLRPHHHQHPGGPSSLNPPAPGGRSRSALDLAPPPAPASTPRAPPARSGTPPGGRTRASPTSAVTVRAADDTPANVTVGPYLFDLALGLHMADNKTPADVIQAHYGSGTLTVDGEPTPRWLAYIQAARDRHEQTLEAFRDPRGYIFYMTMRPLRAGQELLVWYGDELARECGIPVLTPSNIRGDQQYVCTTCNKSYKHPNCLKAHIRFRCTPTRLDFLVSSRSPTDSWLHLTPSPPRRHLETARSPEVRPGSPTSSSPVGPMNLKIGEVSAFRPPRRDSSGEISRQSPDSTRDLRDSPKEVSKENRVFPSLPLPPSSTATTQMAEKRSTLTSPSRAVSLKDTVAPKFSLRPDVSACLPQPMQIFNPVHAPSFPFPVDSTAALKYYYAPLYNKLSAATAAGQMCYNRMLAKPQCIPNNYIDSAMYYHHPYGPRKLPVSPGGDQGSHKLEEAIKPAPHTNMDAAPEGACLPFAFPLPSEKAGEPLDLLPRSLYMHKSRKGHLCIYCGKMYSRKYGLKIHLRTHTGYKPLKCKVCLRPFGDPSNLNKHIRLHAEGETPYRCEYCGKVLVRRRDLERHIKSRHPGHAGKLDAEVSSSGKQSELLDDSEELLTGSPSLSSTDSLDDSLDEDESKDFIDVEDEEGEEGHYGGDVIQEGSGNDHMEDEDDDDDEVDVTDIEVVS